MFIFFKNNQKNRFIIDFVMHKKINKNWEQNTNVVENLFVVELFVLFRRSDEKCILDVYQNTFKITVTG